MGVHKLAIFVEGGGGIFFLNEGGRGLAICYDSGYFCKWGSKGLYRGQNLKIISGVSKKPSFWYLGVSKNTILRYQGVSKMYFIVCGVLKMTFFCNNEVSKMPFSMWGSQELAKCNRPFPLLNRIALRNKFKQTTQTTM